VNPKHKYFLKCNEHDHNISGNSKSIGELIEKIIKVSQTDATVFIYGETGSGKELVAESIHFKSERRSQKLVKINCVAYNDELLESEFFGHEKGSFTGATNSKHGVFEEANNGTLFIDEIGNMSLKLQIKLLRAIQFKTIRKVGSNKDIKINVRLLTATNKNITSLVKHKMFLEELYYRLIIYPIYVPSLKERKEDIVDIARYFLNLIKKRITNSVVDFSEHAIKKMVDYDWPGNVRELENKIEYALINAIDTGKKIIEWEDLKNDLHYAPEHFDHSSSLKKFIDEIYNKNLTVEDVCYNFRQMLLNEIIFKENHDSKKIASILKISHSKIYSYLKERGTGIKKP